MKRLAGLLVAGCALAIAACSNSSSGSCAPGIYNYAPMPVFTMANPAPGATGVPDNSTSLIFSGLPESGAKIILTANGQTVATISTLTPLPEPTSGNPTQSPEYLASLPITLSAATTYTVIYRFMPQNPAGDTCAPPVDSQQLGSFTTQ
jgi:hypothetical protein